MRISDWSSDVCSSDLAILQRLLAAGETGSENLVPIALVRLASTRVFYWLTGMSADRRHFYGLYDGGRSEEHTSELQSLMRISYAVFCLKKKRTYAIILHNIQIGKNLQQLTNII